MSSSYVIGKFCGSNLPHNGTVINSTQSQVTLWFRSDPSVSSAGFSLNWNAALPTCGGTLSGSTYGSITSPGYPGNYPSDRDCVWIVVVPPGNTIRFSIGQLQMEHHDNCSYDFLEFRDGRQDSDQLLQRYCSSGYPQPVTTTGPYAYVRFHSDYSQTDRGFQISYSSISTCGGTYTSDNGILISPNYPNPYPHSAQCIWTITIPAGEVITFTFTSVDLEPHSNCVWDYVELREGTDGLGDFVGRYCGNSTPPVYVSTGNSLWVKFKSDISNRGAGFRATWEVACGGTFTTPTGEIKSPYFPNPYPNERECQYIIRQPVGSTITLTFLSFDIEASRNGNCSHDYLEIHNGESADGPLIGRYCGSMVPAPVQSAGSSLWLKFATDDSVQNHGFRATYETSNLDAGGGSVDGTGTAGRCGGSLTGQVGMFQSPFHPNVYPHGVNCTWFIAVLPGYIIRLTFTAFSLEMSSNCYFDYVQVFDNYTNSGALGKFCGSTLPPVVTSTDNVLTVMFVSDHSIAHEGFSANYVALNSSTVCGGELRDNIGLIRSPNYPGNYPHNRQCEWTIVMPTGRQILLNITDFIMESHPTCRWDYLEIRNGGFATSPLIGKYCGTSVDQTIVSHGNRLYLKFATDASSNHRGFQISYDGTLSGCGGELRATTGSFVSPNFPQPYGRDIECVWQIIVANGSTIRLHFVEFEIESHGSCVFDYVEIRDGNPLGNRIAKLSGNTTPEFIQSTTNRMWVKFRSDFSNHGRGFYASYYASCNNVLTAHSGIIESPNFPNPYPRNRDCTWIIQATLGNTVNASFSHFEIEGGAGSNSSCRNDYVELKDGSNLNSPLIGRYCGHNYLPPAIATRSQNLYLRFVSDAYGSHNGFRLQYAVSGCGGHMTGSTGNFTSLNYPNHYPSRRECVWTIAVTPGSRIELTIQEMDVEAHPACDYDALEVFGGIDSSSFRLMQLCHRQLAPQVITSTGSNLYVRFRSDSGGSGRGFRATYQTISGGCGGNYSSRSGTIMSKNYPDNYEHFSDCLWIIRSEINRPIVFTYEDFDVEGAQDCIFDYVALYATSDFNSSLIMKSCGSSLPNPHVIRSPSNQLYVRMRSDVSVTARGFKATFKTDCGGNLNADVDGIITSPGWPTNYEQHSNCTWIIQASNPGDRITLTFTHIEIEGNVNDTCSFDYVRVLEGNDDENSPILGTYCGTHVPPSITSVGLALVVKFVTDGSVQMKGFQASYSKSTSACGGDLTSEHGAFNSPMYPDSYANNLECTWTITSSPGNRIMLSFNFFDLESSTGCANDFVIIRAGSIFGRVLGQFCGNQIPASITGQNRLFIRFRSNANVPGRGFTAQYNSMYGGAQNGSSGQISSPRYPSNYPHNSRYEWTITTDIGRRISARFLDMDLESHSSCAFDYVKLFDGNTVEAPLLGTFCGIQTPPIIISTGNLMHVVFQSDSSSSGRGFRLAWWAYIYYPLYSTPAPFNTTQSGCGGNLTVTDTFTQLTSPGYPYGYANNLDCIWTLITAVGRSIVIQFTNMSLEAHSYCSYDYVSIAEGSMDLTGTNQLGKFCGAVVPPNPIQSSTNLVMVRMRTDSSVNRTGFALNYRAACGSMIDSLNGRVMSPNFPSNYPDSANCTWTIRVPAGRTVQARFTHFSIVGQTGQCSGDVLEFFNGENRNSPSIIQLCGTSQNLPANIASSTNYLTVNFVSNSDGQTAQGFRFIFTAVQDSCGGAVTLTSDIPQTFISSPNYPLNYPHSVDCYWIISAPPNQRVRFQFVDTFAIESHDSCAYDYVELRDGGTENAPVITKVCGNSLPANTQTSTSNFMWVRFRSDYSSNGAGFRANVTYSSCGGLFVTQNGTIMSPSYPSYYGPNQDCEWFIQAPVGHFITFTFEDVGLEYGSNCSAADYVQIRDGNSTASVIGLICGTTIPAPVNTSDNTAYVRFHSNNRTSSRGFKLNYNASVEVCGGTFTTPTGTLMSPNYPGQYPHSRQCRWIIQVQEGRKITFTFTDMDMQDPYGVLCRRDFVELVNGQLPMSPVIGRYCGNTNLPTVQSSSNSMTVRFVTDGSVSGRGFSATYRSDEMSDCGGALDVLAPSGVLQSPGFDGNGTYNVSEQCVWIINNGRLTNSSIMINFTALDLEEHGECSFDFVEIREGSDHTGHLIGRYCRPHDGLPLVVSPYPSLWIRYVSDVLMTLSGFQLTYNFTDCGGVLTTPTGSIFNNYSLTTGRDCAWKIDAPEGARIKIQFVYMNLYSYLSNCDRGYVEILNGGLPSSPSTGKMCNLRSNDFLSQSNSVRVHFHADATLPPWRSFRLNYMWQWEGCGGNIHAQEGNISSPNYPQTYNNSIECIWDITVDNGYRIQWTFQSPFELESSPRCFNDYVMIAEVYESGLSTVFGRYCGSDLPASNSSSGNRIRIKFRSSLRNGGAGFLLNFTAVCGATYRTARGVITSPGYPSVYDNNLNCTYEILGEPQHNTIITFNPDKFKIEALADVHAEGEVVGLADFRCQYDYLEVFQSNSSFPTGLQSLGRFCGSLAPQPLEGLGRMVLRFVTDSSVKDRGWMATYLITDCGGRFTAPSGTIASTQQSDGFYFYYASNANCTWTITTTADKVIKLRFETFHLEAGPNCAYDAVAVYNGNMIDSSSLIGKFCGTTLPSSVTSSSNQMLINFFSDYSGTGEGFSAEYTTIYSCGGMLNGTTGSFRSLDADNDGRYENDLECLWRIIVPENNRILLQFSSFRLEPPGPNGRCQDFVEIYDGMLSTSPLVGRYCGTEAVGFNSSFNMLLVRFISNEAGNDTGFQATYTTVGSQCGSIIAVNNTEQVIKSPSYPRRYRSNSRCVWAVEAAANELIDVNVTDLDIVPSSSCTTEYLEIKDDPLGITGRVVRTCGSNRTSTFSSKGRRLLITFQSGPRSQTTRRGFSLTFKTATCNRTYTANTGLILSPNWPNNYDHNTHCIMIIRATVGYKISLFFGSVDIEAHPDCDFDYLEVYNSTSSNSTALAKLCGREIPNPMFLTTNVAKLIFSTDYSATRRGFDITYTASASGCGGNLEAPFGTFTSPEYPENLATARSCTWVIAAPQFFHIFLSLQINPSRNVTSDDCVNSSVTVRDGTSSSSFTRYCRPNNIAPIRSSTSRLFVTFSALASPTASNIAFRASYNITSQHPG